MASFNGVSKNVKTSKQDYTNLLFSDSDSDQIPDLKLPPVKGKKKRMKRLSHTSIKDEGMGTTCCSCLKAVFALVVFSTLVVLTALLIWTLQQVSDLQKEMNTMQQNNGQKDIQILQGQIKELEQSLKDLNKAGGVIQNMQNSAGDLSVRLKKVEAATDKLNQSVNSAQALLNVPDQVSTLNHVVADLGSNFHSVQTTQTDLKSKMEALEKQTKELKEQAEAKKSPVDTQYQSMLSQQLAHMNDSTISGINSVREDIDKLKGRMMTLEQYVQSKPTPMEHDELETFILDLVQEKLTNMSLLKSPGEVANSTMMMEGLARLSNTVEDLKTKVDTKNLYENRKDLVYKENLDLFKEITFQNFENLNKTIFVMDEEFNLLSGSVDSISAGLVNVTSRVDMLQQQQQLETRGGDTQQASEKENNDVDLSQQENGDNKTPQEKSETQGNDEIENNTEGEEEVESKEETSTVSPTTRASAVNQSTTTESNRAKLHIEGITTREDLHEAFSSKWPLTDGQLDAESLLSLVTDDIMEDEILNMFDTNRDNFFDEDELRNALGLTGTE